MKLAFKIAWRNIWRHKGKSIVIGLIIFVGALLMTVGNGMISGMEQGLAENIVNLFTGDVVVISDDQQKDNVLFDMMSGKPLEVINDYDSLEQVLETEEIVEQFLPATAGMVFVFNSGAEMGNILLLGVEIERYQQMFADNFKVTLGRNLNPGERGLLLPEEARNQAYDFMDFWALPEGVAMNASRLPQEVKKELEFLDVRRNIIFMGASTSNSTVDIKVPIKGIIKYKSLNKIWGNYCIIDLESFREAHNYVTGADSIIHLAEEQKELLGSEELDGYFGAEEVVDETKVTEESFSISELKEETKRTATEYDVDDGAYNLAFVKLKDDVTKAQALKKLNHQFKSKELNLRAVDWKDAVGTIGSMALMIKGALNVFIMFIFFVAIIVIMNTLSMAALERISELAMMRAIGAKKWFLRKMFLFETGILSFFFGGLGIIGGVIIIYLLRALDITTTNELLQMVYGGDQLNPLVTIGDLGIGIIELGIVTLLSVLYPLKVVGRIVPLDAITRE